MIEITSDPKATYSNAYQLTWRLVYEDDGGAPVNIWEISYIPVLYTSNYTNNYVPVHGATPKTVEAKGDSLRMFRIEGLKANTYYEVRIRAINAIGPGASTPIVISTLDGMFIFIL